MSKLPITVIIAAKNEAANIGRCLETLSYAEKIYIVDSHSTDATEEIATKAGAQVVQFDYKGGYPRKRQWAMGALPVTSHWIMLIDADETVTDALWRDISLTIERPDINAASALKQFHFLGRRMRFGGFSHSAVILFRNGIARFEQIAGESDDGCDMEVHERLIVTGRIVQLNTPLIHDDFKTLDSYLEKHRKYALWEANARHNYFKTGSWGDDEAVVPDILGNIQQRRRYLKGIVMKLPFEPLIWFLYHYVIRLGFLEGSRGYLASKIRAKYISDVRQNLKRLQDNK